MADSIERIAADCAWESHRLRNSGSELADYEAWERIATRLRALSPAGGDEIKLDVLRIPRSKSLDPITVYFEDHAPGVGRVTIACYGDAWTAAWSAMGERTVRQFIADVDAGYLSGAMLQLCGGNDRHRSYTDRVAAAVVAALAASPQQEPGAVGGGVRWELLPSYLIDHCEGDTISEEGLQHAVAAMLRDPKYSHSKPTPADESGAFNALADDEAERKQYERDKLDPSNCLTTPTDHDPSGQTLAGAGGEDAFRAEFERWANPQGFRLNRRDFKGSARMGQYCEDITQAAYEAFREGATLTATSAGTTGDAEKWIPDEMDVDNTMLHVRYGIDYMMGWNECRDSFLLAARRAREVG